MSIPLRDNERPPRRSECTEDTGCSKTNKPSEKTPLAGFHRVELGLEGGIVPAWRQPFDMIAVADESARIASPDYLPDSAF